MITNFRDKKGKPKKNLKKHYPIHYNQLNYLRQQVFFEKMLARPTKLSKQTVFKVFENNKLKLNCKGSEQLSTVEKLYKFLGRFRNSFF